MKQELFPEEIIANSQEKNFSVHSVRSRVIYSTIVFSLIILFALLPFIKVDVGVRSQGVIRPVTEVIQVSSPVSGQIKMLNAKENSFVSKNEIIATIDATALQDKLRHNESRQNQLTLFIHDLNQLQNHSINLHQLTLELKTIRFQQALQEFKQEIFNQQQIIDQQKRSLDRETILYNRDAVSISMLEEHQYTLQIEKNRLKLLGEQQFNRWNVEKISFENELDELKSGFSQLSQELKNYEIRSPVTGTVQNSSGITEDSFIFANQVLGEISPDTNLIAEVYVNPKDIGLLREGLPVRLQIDAYNHNQWGTASGEIVSISTDMLLNDNTPMFKVRCSIDELFLELTNGFKGEIKKGMTFQARFIVNRRSLLQLLYDKVDDWVNPEWPGNSYESNTTKG